MKLSTFITISFLSFSSTVVAAPTPQLKNILASITNPSAGNDNKFLGNGNGSGSGNGNGNSAGNGAGSGNTIGSGNSAGNGNTFSFPSILKDRDLESGLTNILGSITNPGAGNNNVFKNNGNGSGSQNGNGNSAGNGAGSGNTIGSGNQAGNGNTFNVSPNVSPSVALPDIELPDIAL